MARAFTWTLLSVAGFQLCSCAAGDLAFETSDDGAYYGDPNATAEPAGDDDDDSDGELPEEGNDAFYRAEPAATDHYVFVVNPDRDTLSKINATTRSVYTLDVGLHPTQVLVGVMDPNKAVVLNEGDATLSIVDATTDALRTMNIHPDTNYMDISSDGKYVITTYNDQVENASDTVEGVRSYSSISVVFTGDSATEATSTPLAVGLNPRAPAFISSTDQALVMCDDALAQIYLSPEPTSRLIQLTRDVDEDLKVAETRIGPDGHYAFLRLTEIPQLMVVDLTVSDSSSAVSRIDLDAVPTDLDVSEDTLIVVDRQNRQILFYNAIDPTEAPTVINTPENQLVGSVMMVSETNQAILYSTLTQNDVRGTAEEDTPLNRFSLLELDTYSITLFELVKSVESVTMNHNSNALAATFVHHGSADSDVAAFDNEESFSQFYFSDSLVVPSVLEDPVKNIATSPSGMHEYMILENNLNVILVDYKTRQVEAVAMQSQPVFVGILTGQDTSYVSQEHELGRLSFIDPDTETVSTITGFELNSQL